VVAAARELEEASALSRWHRAALKAADRELRELSEWPLEAVESAMPLFAHPDPDVASNALMAYLSAYHLGNERPLPRAVLAEDGAPGDLVERLFQCPEPHRVGVATEVINQVKQGQHALWAQVLRELRTKATARRIAVIQALGTALEQYGGVA
jgi:hypothetical protein